MSQTIKIIFAAFLFFALAETASASLTINAPRNYGTLNQGLVGWWTFDGKDLKNNVTDSSGLGNNGYMQGFGATSSAVTIGKIGQGLSFDGVDDRVTLSSGSSIGTGNFTLSVHVKYTPADRGIIYSQGSTIYDEPFLLLDVMSLSEGKVGFRTRDNATNMPAYLFSPTDLDDGKWHHIVITQTGVSSLRTRIMYVDGVAGTPQTSVIFSTATFNSYRFGTLQSGDSSELLPFNGSLDDIRIYSRALSASEIKQLYNQGVGSKVNASQQTDTTTSLKTGLVGHWTFDSKDLKTNVADTSGLGNNGYLTNFGATSSAVTAGKLGQGLKFDGVNDYVSVNDSASLNMSATNALTISVWAKFNQLPSGGGDCRYLVYKSDAPGLWICGNGVILFRLGGTVTAYAPGLSINKKNIWYHFVATYDGTKEIIYVNGVLAGQQTSVGTIGSNSDILKIGGFNAATCLDKILDDVRIYSRALSASEIKQLYNMSGSKVNTSQQGLSSGLVGWWTFDGANMKNNVADSSGAGNHGALAGFTSTSSAVTIGKLGQGLKFDGVNDYVSAASITSDANFASSTFSVAYWAKSTPRSGHNGFCVVCKDGTINGWRVMFTATGLVGIQTTSSYVPMITRYSASVVADEKWHYIVAVISTDSVTVENNNADLYVDGILNQGSLTQGLYKPSNYPVRIGSVNPSFFYRGSLDDVRIYSRALSASEVKQLYNMGR